MWSPSVSPTRVRVPGDQRTVTVRGFWTRSNVRASVNVFPVITQFDMVRPLSIFQPGSWDLGESLLPSCTGHERYSQAGLHSVHTGGPHAGENLRPWPSCSLWVETNRGVSPSAARPGTKSPDGSQAHAGILMSLGLLLISPDLRYSPQRGSYPRAGTCEHQKGGYAKP